MIAAGTALAAPGTVSAVAAVALAVVFVGLWAISVRVRDASIVDPAWGPAFVVVALVCLVIGDAERTGGEPRRWVLFGLTAVWGLRLGGYLLVRKLGDPAEDRRYAKMRERRGDTRFALYSLAVIFVLQGLLVLVVSLPLQVAAERSAALDWLAAGGTALWAVGLFFEAVGDEQMRRFKARPDSEGQVMDTGLWRYTRHPNYFGDFCVWWGLWLVALGAGGTWWTVVGPLVMSFLLIKGSGAALLERDIGERRPEYADYIRRTSAFVPWPPRRGRAPGSSSQVL
jgi:steroid 5-alpha reductase family enzyme